MAVIGVGRNEQLTVEPRRDFLRMYAAAAGARIELQLSMATQMATPVASAQPFHVVADLYATRRRGQNERMVCELTARHLVTPTPQGASVTLAGFIGLEQLRAIEDLRGGGDLVLHLELGVFTVADERAERYRGDENVDVRAEEWARELERVTATTAIEVLVPMPDLKKWVLAAERIRAGRDMLRTDDEPKTIDAALVNARKALEAIRAALKTSKTATAARAVTDKMQRDQAQRKALLIEALTDYIQGAAHDDPVTAGFVYTRTEAITVLATVAGLLRDTIEP